MKKYSILKQVFGLCKEVFCFRDKGFVFEQISDVTQQMDKAFLFAKSFDQTKVRTPEVTYNDTVVPKVVNNDFRTSAFVNMEESDIRVGEYPEPVTLPAGFINMHKWKFGQRLFQSFVCRSSLFSKLMVKSNQRSRYYFQSAQVFQYLQRTVIGSLSLITDISCFSSGIRPDKSVGNFVITPAVNNVFTITTPVVGVPRKAGMNKLDNPAQAKGNRQPGTTTPRMCRQRNMRSWSVGGSSAVTQVKAISPEMVYNAQGQGVYYLETSIIARVKGECDNDVPGSQATAGDRTVHIGTWENRIDPQRSPRQVEEARRRYGNTVVGLSHIRGVNGVMPIEGKSLLEGDSGRTQRVEDAYAIF